MDRAELVLEFMEFLDNMDERHPEELDVRIGFLAIEVDCDDQLDYVFGFMGEDRTWVQDAFLDQVQDVRDGMRMVALDEED